VKAKFTCEALRVTTMYSYYNYYHYIHVSRWVYSSATNHIFPTQCQLIHDVLQNSYRKCVFNVHLQIRRISPLQPPPPFSISYFISTSPRRASSSWCNDDVAIIGHRAVTHISLLILYLLNTRIRIQNNISAVVFWKTASYGQLNDIIL